MLTLMFETYPATPAPTLHPEIRATLDAAPPFRSYDEIPIDEVRNMMNTRIRSAPRANEPVERIENREIPGPRGPIPVRIYTPHGAGPFPLVLLFHGGGWVLGNLDTHDDFGRSLCSRAEATVVSVDYRLAPEHKFPTGFDDCYAALEWAHTQASRIALVGDSSGGNLAAAVALKARDVKRPKIACQVLLYPATNHNFDTAAFHENAAGFGLSRETTMFYWKRYLAQAEDGLNPYASPLQAQSLADLPPALIVTAHFDPLRDDGFAYAARLQQAGVPVHTIDYLDMNHGFVVITPTYDSSRHALAQIAQTLKAALYEPATVPVMSIFSSVR